MVTILSSLVVPCALALAVWRPILPQDRGLIVLVGPLLVLFAPAVNFYDLALAALPLLTLLRPDRRSDLLLVGVVVVVSQVIMLVKDIGVGGLCFLLAMFFAALFVKAVARERAEISSSVS